MKVLIAVPCLSGLVRAETCRSLFALKRPPDSAIQFAVGSIITTARNELVKSAIDNGFSHIFFVDDDMVFPSDSLERLAAHGKPIVGAYGVKKKLPIERCGEPVVASWEEADYEKIIEMKSLGMAVCLINVAVFEKIPEPWFEWTDVSEDVGFCRRARSAGLKIWADTHLSADIGHVGSFTYYADGHAAF